MKKFKIFIDGSCIKNPGPGGCGILIIDDNNYSLEFSQGYYLTTNNRMELKSAIIALKYIYIKSLIKIYTDSLYLKNGITIWIKIWKKRNWKLYKKNKIIKNIDLWLDLYKISKFHKINWIWIKKNSYKNNIICDILAKKSSKNPKFIDIKYTEYINEYKKNFNKSN